MLRPVFSLCSVPITVHERTDDTNDGNNEQERDEGDQNPATRRYAAPLLARQPVIGAVSCHAPRRGPKLAVAPIVIVVRSRFKGGGSRRHCCRLVVVVVKGFSGKVCRMRSVVSWRHQKTVFGDLSGPCIASRICSRECKRSLVSQRESFSKGYILVKCWWRQGAPRSVKGHPCTPPHPSPIETCVSVVCASHSPYPPPFLLESAAFARERAKGQSRTMVAGRVRKTGPDGTCMSTHGPSRRCRRATSGR